MRYQSGLRFWIADGQEVKCHEDSRHEDGREGLGPMLDREQVHVLYVRAPQKWSDLHLAPRSVIDGGILCLIPVSETNC